MMHYLLIAISLLFCACASPAYTARKQVNRVAQATMRVDAGLRDASTRAAVRLGDEEGTLRGKALRDAGCPSSAASQPANRPDCQELARKSLQRYAERLSAIADNARKVDAAIGAVWATLLLVTDLLDDIEDGLSDKQTLPQKLPKLLTAALNTYADARAAYDSFLEVIK